jgi:hypothetical protein
MYHGYSYFSDIAYYKSSLVGWVRLGSWIQGFFHSDKDTVGAFNGAFRGVIT